MFGGILWILWGRMGRIGGCGDVLAGFDGGVVVGGKDGGLWD